MQTKTSGQRELFLTSKDHTDFLGASIARGPSRVFISTFGIYLGITYDGRDTTEWGPSYALKTRELAEAMRSIPDVSILVGLQQYRSCKGKFLCTDCEKQYIRSLVRLVNHTELFPEFHWRMTTDLHLKCVLFFYPDKKDAIGVTGGRNFTDSDWEDATFSMSHAEIIKVWAHTRTVWKKAIDVTDKAVNEILAQQGLSEKGMQAVLEGMELEPGFRPFRACGRPDPPF